MFKICLNFQSLASHLYIYIWNYYRRKQTKIQ